MPCTTHMHRALCFDSVCLHGYMKRTVRPAPDWGMHAGLQPEYQVEAPQQDTTLTGAGLAQAAKGRKGRAMQRQAEVWPTVQDSLDIDFEHWNPDEIAQQWNARARAALGASCKPWSAYLPG